MQRRFQAAALFTPAAPVTEQDLLAGRTAEINELLVACGAPGKHAIVFGERGVGKTSLASVFGKVVDGLVVRTTATCESTDTFQSVVARLLSQVTIPFETADKTMGFVQQEDRHEQQVPLNALPGFDGSSESIGRLCQQLNIRLLLVVDEFDRLAESERRGFADCIKVLSDQIAPVTIIIVGVAAVVQDLIGQHQSIERALAQIRLDRLDVAECKAIVEKRLPKLGLSSSPPVLESIANLSQGLPHFVHLVGLGTVMGAIERSSLVVEDADLATGVRKSIRQADQSILSAYQTATYSPRVDALYTKVLCACAMAETDEMGFFNARQVLPHMQRLHGNHVSHSHFTKHLNQFSTARGHVLEQVGSRRKYQYRFRNPMMRAYVLLRAVDTAALKVSDVQYTPAKRFI